MLPSLPKRSQSALILALFFVCTLAVYAGSLRNGFVDWDDPLLITENPIVHSFNATSLKKAFTSYDPELYIPLTFVSYQIETLIGGLSPFIMHATNLLLHTLNAALVAWLLYLLLGHGWIALALGLLFAVHPLNTEAVAWASARKDVLSTFFFLGAFITELHAAESGRRTLLWTSLLLFVLGCLSKVMIVTLPILLLLVHRHENGLVDRNTAKRILPYGVIAVIFVVIGLFGKSKALVITTLSEKILMAFKSTVFSISAFIWPQDLSVLYPYTKRISLVSPDFFVPVILVLAMFVIVFLLRKRLSLLVTGFLFYLVALSPTFLNFAKGGDLYVSSDRYAYIPMIGLLMIIGTLLREYTEGATTVRDIRSRTTHVTALCIAAICASGILAIKQAQTWKDTFSLFQHTLKIYPASDVALNNTGMAYLLRGETGNAISFFEKALAAKEDPKTIVNLAAAHVEQGKYEEAMSSFSRALAIDPENTDAFYGIGNMLLRTGKLEEAVKQYEHVLVLDPNYFNAYNNLGGAYLRLGEYEKASHILEQSIELRPDFVESHYNLAIAYIQLKKFAEAEPLLRDVVEMNPNDADALSNLALVLYRLKRVGESVEWLKKAFNAEPNHPVAVDLILTMKRDGYVQ